MLREINLRDLGKHDPDDILILYDEAVYTVDEFDPLIRVLVDEEEDDDDYEFMVVADEDEDEDEEWIPFPDKEPVTEDEPIQRMVYHSTAEVRMLIKEAQDLGFSNAYAIAQHTGLAYSTVHRTLKKMNQEAEENEEE